MRTTWTPAARFTVGGSLQVDIGQPVTRKCGTNWATANLIETVKVFAQNADKITFVFRHGPVARAISTLISTCGLRIAMRPRGPRSSRRSKRVATLKTIVASPKRCGCLRSSDKGDEAQCWQMPHCASLLLGRFWGWG